MNLSMYEGSLFVLFCLSCWDLLNHDTLPFVAKAAMSMDGCPKYASCFDLLSSY